MAKSRTHPRQKRIFFFLRDRIIPVFPFSQTFRLPVPPLAGGRKLFFVRLPEKPICAPPSTTPAHTRTIRLPGRPGIIFRTGLPENQFRLRPPRRPRAPKLAQRLLPGAKCYVFAPGNRFFPSPGAKRGLCAPGKGLRSALRDARAHRNADAHRRAELQREER